MMAELDQGICTYIIHWHLKRLFLVSTVLSLDPCNSTGTSQPRRSSPLPSPAAVSPTASVGISASLLLLSSDEEENTGEETTHPPADTVVETPATDVSDATTSHVTINSAPQHKRKSIRPMPYTTTRME